jgi:GT2 family glycosyltransferase
MADSIAGDPRNSALREAARVTVVVVNFNGGEYVLRALRALEGQTFRDFRAVVVDNASTDGSARRIELELPGVKLVRSSQNLGFAGGNNLGFREGAASEWIALLNPDAFPEPDWLEKLLAAAARRPNCAAVGSRLLRADDAATLDGIGDVYHVSGLHWRDGYGKAAAGRGLEGAEVFSPCAAAALYRGDVLRALGGFDEDYFCYSEDVDLGFRMRLLGYNSWYAPDSIAHHVGSATTGLKSDFTMYHGVRNGIWTFLKNMPGPLLWLFMPALLLGFGMVAAKLAIRGQAGVAWRALKDSASGLPEVIRKRRTIQASRRASVAEIWRVLDKSLPGMRR